MTNASFSFNGVRKDFIFCEDDGREQSVFAPLTRNLLTLPGMPGAFLESTETQIRVIRQRVFYRGLNGQDLRKLEEELAAWLVTQEAVPLIFDDEPDRVYYAAVDGSFNIEESLEIGGGTITFNCPDPYKNGPTITAPINSTDPVFIENEGTAETKPIFRFNVLQSITHLDIIKDDSYFAIGRPVDVTEYAKPEYERLLYDEMESFVGWTSNGTVLDTGETVSGAMSIVDEIAFGAGSYGSGNGWHGPALKKSIPGGPLLDFKAEMNVGFYNHSPDKIGRVTLYLLDDQNRIVAKIELNDSKRGVKLASRISRVGDDALFKHITMQGDADKIHDWGSVIDKLSIERKSGVWRVYFAEVDKSTGEHVTKKLVYWADNEKLFTRNVAQVQVHIGAFGTAPTATPYIYSLQVWKVNPLGEHDIPYIAQPGDEIVIDFESENILINGESRTDLKDFGAEYFSLLPGESVLLFEPSGSIDGTADWREKYK